MAEILNNDVQRPAKGLHTDSSPMDQPQGTYRYALNAVDESNEGDHGFRTREGSNVRVTDYSPGFVPIGQVYMSNNTVVVFSVNPATKLSEIGILNKDEKYTPLITTGVLKFDVRHQIDAHYRVRRANENFIYWTDGINNARSLNMDNLYAYYSQAFKAYIATGADPALFTGEKWAAKAFELVTEVESIPRFADVEILPYGNIKSGSYNFAISYEDADGNPSGWVTVSNTVNIFVDSDSSAYHRIRGSRNVQNEVQSFPNANKSIQITLNNLDQNFPFYRVAVIQAYDGTGNPSRAVVLPKRSTKSPVFIYSGNDDQLAETPVEDIQIDPPVILAPEHIDQLDNRLLLANTKGADYDWCNFQQYASRIGSDLTTEAITLNSVESPPNIKNPHSTFTLRGYMPGCVYSFGIVYIMKGNIYSPVFHIPGKSPNNTTSRMKVYELANTVYQDIHNCDGNTNYWGRDAEGDILRGNPTRHHQFPTRKDVNIDLISSTNSPTIITRYRMRYVISLKTGQTFPVDNNGDPLSIPFTINYQNVGDPTPLSYNGFVSVSTLGTETVFYDSALDIDPVPYSPDYAEFDPASPLVANYSTVFDYTTEYESYVLDVIENTTTSDIFGIEFSNIEKPHPDVIGFFIVRNERLETDKVVVDNAIMGTMIKTEAFSAFTHLMTDFPYPFYDERASWIFSPEHQFLGKFPQYQNIKVEGFYRQTFKHVPVREDPMIDPETGNTIPDASHYQGVTTRDVMAGTSYNPDIDKKKYRDTDGFALVVGYRASDLAWSLDNDFPNLIPVDSIHYLSAASNKLADGINIYNVSCDNKIGVVKFETPIDTNLMYNDNAGTSQVTYGTGRITNTSPKPNIERVAYVTLTNDNRNAYEDFMVRSYYKEHNNPILFGNANSVDQRVFNGDVQISGMNISTLMFNKLDFAERKKKKSWWKIVLGSVLVVAGAILSIFGGSGVPIVIGGIALLTGAAIGIGVSMIMSGIKLEKMKSMVENDYEKGLLSAVVDWEVAGQMSSLPFGYNPDFLNLGDDNIQWFADRLNNVYIETSVSVGLRSGVTGNITDFIDAPAPYDDDEYRSYLTEKLTTLDTERDNGRLYRGFPVSEFYDINLDYMRFNKQKSYIYLPENYNCCSDKREDYPLRVWYSQQSFQEEATDNYRVFLPQNYRDIQGEHGEITDLYKVGSSLYIHTKEALWQLPQNLQERVNSDLISFIGTGDFFAINPVKITDNSLGTAGTQHKWATQKTSSGVFFVSELESKVFLHGEGLRDISQDGNKNWFSNNLKSHLTQQVYDLSKFELNIDNNPAYKNGIGIHSVYDTRHSRYIVTKRDFLIREEWADTFVVSSIFAAPFNVLYFDTGVNAFVVKKPGNLQQLFTRVFIDFEDAEYFENKSWTMSYSLNNKTWTGWHSYLPNFYMSVQNEYFSSVYDSTGIWKHNNNLSYCNFYGIDYPHILEVVSTTDNPLMTKIWNDFTLYTTAQVYDPTRKQFVDNNEVTFNKLIAYNERQSTGETLLVTKVDDSDYLFQQTQDLTGSILIDRVENKWQGNDLRDYVVDYTVPLFTSNWVDIAPGYPIDKVINPVSVDFSKDWDQLQSLRSQYLILRYKFDNFANVKLTTNYLLEGEQISFR